MSMCFVCWAPFSSAVMALPRASMSAFCSLDSLFVRLVLLIYMLVVYTCVCYIVVAWLNVSLFVLHYVMYIIGLLFVLLAGLLPDTRERRSRSHKDMSFNHKDMSFTHICIYIERERHACMHAQHGSGRTDMHGDARGCMLCIYIYI